MKRLATVLFSAALLYTPLAAASFESEQNFRSAMAAFKERNFYSARLLLQEIALKDARGEYGDDAQYYTALSYYYEGEYKAAQFEFKSLMRDYPDSPFVVRAFFWTGEAWFYRKAYREALESHAAFVRKYRENPLAASALYTMGFIYNEQNRYDEAVDVLERALKDYPKTNVVPALTLQLGIALFNAKEYAKARRHFETLLVNYTQAENLDEARFWLGKSYYAENKFDEALREFDAVVKDYPKSKSASEALYLAALSKYKQRALDEALLYLARVTHEYPQSAMYPFARLREAQLFYEKKDWDAALIPILDLVDNHREHETFFAALQLMAEIRQKQGKTAEALKALEALRTAKNLQGKNRRDMLRYYSDLLYQEKQYATAAAVLDELTEEYSGDNDAATYFLLRARAEFRDNRSTDAQKTLAQLEKKYNDAKVHAEALFLKAEIAYSLGKFTQALQFYARLIKKYPKHTKVFDAEMGIGWTYFELKQYARAGDSFRKILRKYKKSDEQAKAYLALGACLYNLRDLQGALKSYKTILEKFLTQHDEATEARYQMAWLHFRQNKFDEAILEFQKYIALGENEPRHADALYFSGLSYFQTGKYAEAINHFERAAHTPNAPAWLKEKALADLARSQNSAGQIADAQKTYKALIEAYPQSSVYDEALYQLVLLAFKTNDEASAIEWKGQLKAHNSKSPWYAEALRETADFYRKEKRFTLAEHALVELEEAQKKPEEKLTTLVLRASLHFEEGRDEKAKALTLKILQNEEITDATANSAAALLFRIYEKQGAYVDGEKEAVRLCTRFAENSLLKEEMLLHQAHFLTLQKKFSASREALTPLATSRHTGARARFAIAETYRAENDTTHALDFYRQITQKQDEGLYLKARFYIGQILFDRKDYEAAAREFSRVAYADSRDDATYEKALYYAARAFREIQKEKEFETFREKLKEAFPQSTYIKELETP